MADDNEVHLYSEDELLRIGLLLVGYKQQKINNAKDETNKYRFRVHFGADPIVLNNIWFDLQTTDIEEAFLPPGATRNINHFLMACHHLKLYPTEIEREPIFDISPVWGRHWCWYFVAKIQALKATKIVMVANNGGTDDWIMTVDGVHCWWQEPRHKEWSQDRKFFSHKYAHAGLAYELGISLFENQVVWMNGSFRAGRNDKSIFTDEDGLRDFLVSIGKRAIGDRGYTGHDYAVSTPNPHDDKEVAKFKSRAQMRHETFNGLIKNFNCLNGRFRHSRQRFDECFEAVVVICQYQIETTRPLFDIMLEDMI